MSHGAARFTVLPSVSTDIFSHLKIRLALKRISPER